MRSSRALLLWLAMTGMAADDGRRHVCNVEDVQGTGARVERAAPPAAPAEPLIPYAPLFEGDRVVFQDSRSRVEVLCGGEREILHKGERVWVAPRAVPPPGRAAHIMAWLRDFFLTAERHDESVASLRVRGDDEPPSLPLLAGADGVFAAGRSALFLAWTGGAAPFSVRIYRPGDGQTVWSATGVGVRRARLSGEPVAPGTYELEIRDAHGKAGGARLRALGPADLPAVPPAFAAGGADDLVGRTLEAGWLAAQGGGRLGFEAYQRAAEIAETHGPARLLRDALEQGLRPGPAPADDPGSGAQEKASGRALLVGVTKYIHLPQKRQLEGSGNDAALLRELLTGARFRFDPDRVTVLAGWPADERLRPTRANISHEFARLAAESGPGEVVVIFLAGHGSQQPADADPDDPEPDGLDETFLPADAAGWNGRAGHVDGAIRDDDIRAWVAAIRARGAFVWLLVDACHSGTLVRGNPLSAERERRLPADQVVPEEVLREARGRTLERGGALGISPEDRDLVALYAAQPDELTPEMRLPTGEGPWHGLLTWTVAEVLSESASPLTYRELAERVTARYRMLQRFSPTPLLEGGGLDRRVLGLEEWPERPQILLAGADPERPGSFRLRAGSLLGLRPGSVLRVYPPAGAPQAGRPLGHVEIVSAGALDSLAAPVAYAGAPAPLADALVAGARCEPVLLQYGDLGLRVAVQTQGASAPGAETPEPVTWPRGAGPPAIEAALARLERAGGLVARADEAGRADWLVRQHGADTLLVPASGWSERFPGRDRFTLGSKAGETADETAAHLASLLGRVARARGLLEVAREAIRTAEARPEEAGVRLELLRASAAGAPADPVPFGPAGRLLRRGDRVAFRITNSYRHPADVTLLFIDNGYGIDPLFPRAAQYNRLAPGESVTTKTFTVDAKTAGPEQVVAIAVRGGGTPVSFAYLAQPTLEPASSRAGHGDRSVSALARLLESVLYGKSQARTPTIDEAAGYSISFLGWTTMPERGGP